MPIYLDNSATTRPSEAVIAAMTHSMREAYYNPSALYAPALHCAADGGDPLFPPTRQILHVYVIKQYVYAWYVHILLIIAHKACIISHTDV